MVIFPTRNANIYKMCELHRAIFSSFYNNSHTNFAILLILRCSVPAMVMVSFKISTVAGIKISNLDQNFDCSWNHPPLVATMAIGACAFCAGYEML